jgi:hypothetical protein
VWVIGNYEEGPLLRACGPFWLAEHVPALLGPYRGVWGRFLRWVGEPDTAARRRYWRGRGFRPVRVRVRVEACPQAELAES